MPTVFRLPEKISADNAMAVGKELMAAFAEQGELLLDAEQLQYISSAGLRSLLTLRKAQETLEIINVSSEVYEIFDLTGFTEILTIRRALKQINIDGREVIGRGAKGTVYRYNDDTIVKLYNNPDSLPLILNERRLARTAFILGIPTAISFDVCRIGENYGSVFELLDCSSFSHVIANEPEKEDNYIRMFADLLRLIHNTPVKADDMPNGKERSYKRLDGCKDILPAHEWKQIKDLLDALPDSLHMLHGDYHTNNVMLNNGEALLIDMDTLAYGDPVIELGNIYLAFVGFGEIDPEKVEQFIGLPYETCCRIWKKFLPLYLETEDETQIRNAENKARLLAYIRYLRHILRRGEQKSEKGAAVLAHCKEQISMLLPQIQTLSLHE